MEAKLGGGRVRKPHLCSSAWWQLPVNGHSLDKPERKGKSPFLYSCLRAKEGDTDSVTSRNSRKKSMRPPPKPSERKGGRKSRPQNALRALATSSGSSGAFLAPSSGGRNYCRRRWSYELVDRGVRRDVFTTVGCQTGGPDASRPGHVHPRSAKTVAIRHVTTRFGDPFN